MKTGLLNKPYFIYLDVEKLNSNVQNDKKNIKYGLFEYGGKDSFSVCSKLYSNSSIHNW